MKAGFTPLWLDCGGTVPRNPSGREMAVSVESSPQPASAHVIVLGSHKDGVGKTTIAMHVAVALLNFGQRVATLDLDAQRQTLTQYVAHRRAAGSSELRRPTHLVSTGGSRLLVEEEAIEFFSIVDAVTSIGATHDVIVVDTPASDSDLIRFVHSLADTLITPLDSRLDGDIAGAYDAQLTGTQHYAELVRGARQRRNRADGKSIDWVVVRNRLSATEARESGAASKGLNGLAGRLAFRCVEGLAERAVYGELFARGLTVLDRLDQATLGAPPNLAHVTAQREVTSLITGLALPVGPGQWPSPPIAPLGEHDLLKT
jgi:chromosome partitioning protein